MVEMQQQIEMSIFAKLMPLFLLLQSGLAGAQDSQVSISAVPSPISVLETSATGMILANVTASSTAGGTIAYSFTGSVSSHYLKFSSSIANGGSSVSIVLNNQLSYLEMPYFVAVFSATDNHGYTAYERFLVQVNPVPNVPPIWNNLPYTVAVLENSTLGTSVCNLSAWNPYELDLGGSVSYFINDATGTFSVSSGIVHLNSRLDFLAQSTYYAPVYATTNVTSVALTSSTMLTINVRDVPNRPPAFQRAAYYATIYEDHTVPSILLTVLAYDPDWASPSPIVYSILPGAWSSYFSIGADTGVITQALFISWASCNGLVVFTVQATKSSTQFHNLSTTVGVAVQVQGADLNPPVFNLPQYQAVVPASAPIGTVLSLQPFLSTIHVTDADIGQNAVFSLQLLMMNQSVETHFSVSPSFAQANVYASLVVNANLQSISGTVSLLIVATNTNTSAMRSSSATVVITVQPTVSFPLFSQTYYSFSVPEDASAGLVIGTVTASDSISGSGVGITYSLNGTYTSVFSVVSSNGTLVLLHSPLNYQQQSMYVLAFVATLAGVSTSSNVVINVLNVDNLAPQFVPTNYYSVNASQAMPAGSAVIQVRAIDPDYMDSVVYSLQAASTVFAINATSGIITIISPLSYATTPSYSLTVLATKTRIAASSTAVVNVQVQYANVFAPVFTAPNTSSLVVDGNLPAGYTLFTATAVDPNLPAGASSIAYSLLTAPSSLVINRNTGVVSTTSAFMYQTPASFVVVVQANSSATAPVSQQLSSVLQLTVLIRTPPIFTQNAYFVLSFYSSTAVGSTVSQLQAVDNNLDGSPIAYSLNYSASSPTIYANAFAVNSNGTVTLQSSLANASGLVTLVANAQNAFGLGTSALIYVLVQQINSFAPHFVWPPINSTVYFTTLTGGSLAYTFFAQDSDSGNNGVVRYMFLAGCGDNQYFSLESISGKLTATSNLSAVKTQFTVCVQAYDLGLPNSLSTNTTLSLVLFYGIGSPSFPQNSVTFSMPEGSVGTIGTLPLASVAGSSVGVCYYVIAGDPLAIFQLNASTAVLTLNRNLSASSSPSIYLLGFATTNCNPAFDHPGLNGNDAAIALSSLGPNIPAVITINVLVTVTLTVTQTQPTTHVTSAYLAPRFATSVLVTAIVSTMAAGSTISNIGVNVTVGTSGSFNCSLAGPCNITAASGVPNNPINVTSQGLIVLNFTPQGNSSGTVVCPVQVSESGITNAPSSANLYIYVLTNSQIFVTTLTASQNYAQLDAYPISSYLASSLHCFVAAPQVLPNAIISSYSDVYLAAVNSSTMQVMNANAVVDALSAMQSQHQLTPFYSLYGVASLQSAVSTTTSTTNAATSSTYSPTSIAVVGSTTLVVAVAETGLSPLIIVCVILGCVAAIAVAAAALNYFKYERLKRYDVTPKRRARNGNANQAYADEQLNEVGASNHGLPTMNPQVEVNLPSPKLAPPRGVQNGSAANGHSANHSVRTSQTSKPRYEEGRTEL